MRLLPWLLPGGDEKAGKERVCEAGRVVGGGVGQGG
jgi:hypothetical protein